MALRQRNGQKTEDSVNERGLARTNKDDRPEPKQASELRRAQEEIDVERRRYYDLYDLHTQRYSLAG